MEVLVQLQNLVQVLLLHLRPCLAHPALIIREQDLIDDDVVDVDIELGQLLDQTLCFIHRQELGDADCNEGGLGRVLHVLVYGLRVLPHLLHLAEDGVQSVVQLLAAAED